MRRKKQQQQNKNWWLAALVSQGNKNSYYEIKIHQNEMSWGILSCHSLVLQKIDFLHVPARVQS